MQKTLRWLGYLSAVALMVAGAWGAYTVAKLFIAASSTVKLGVITAVISVATLVYNNARQQAREIKSRHFVEKRQAYQKFFDLMFEIFASQRTGKTLTETETIERMQAIVKDVMIWGSTDTINQYNTFTRNTVNPLPEGDPRIFGNIEDLLRSLRRDLGHDDRKLERLGLTKLLIKADEHDRLGV